jgi:hypothetical protein
MAEDVVAYLESLITADATLAPLVDGGYYTTWLIRQGPKATPGAFDEVGVPKVSLVVLDPRVVPNAQALMVPDAADAYVTVWMYGPDTDVGWSALETLRPALYTYLADLELQFSSGVWGFWIWAGELATRRNDDEFQGSINGNLQFRVVHQRQRYVPA